MRPGEDGFAAALMDPARPVPPGLSGPGGAPAGRRFDVYRNNVVVSLMRALDEAFPAIRALLGETGFARLAQAHVRRHPPRSPLMMQYGADLPGFLQDFPPLAALGYLPDLARLELARRAAYHAADATPLPPARLRALPVERLLHSRLTLAPALQLCRSRWPVESIRRAALDHRPLPGGPGEAVLLTRPGFDPVTTLLPPGGATFVLALAGGESFGAAWEAADAAVPGFDAAPVLAALLSGGAITGCATETADA